MPVFNTFFRIFKKHIKSSLIYVGVFVLVGILFSQMGGDSTEEYKMRSCKIAVFDYDQSEASQRLIDYLSTIHDLRFDYKNDGEYLQDRLYYRDISYVLYIEEGFSKTGKLSNIKRQGTNVGVYIDGQIATYMKAFAAVKQAGYDEEEAYELTLKALDSSEVVTLKGNSTIGFDSIYQFFRYEAYVLLMIMFTMLSPILIAFNKKETRDRLSISALSSRESNAQLFLGSFLTSLMIWALFLVLGIAMSGGEFGEKELLANLNALVFTVVAASISTIIGSFTMEAGALAMMTNVVGLAMCFLGGVFVPMQFFGKSLQMVSRLFPTHWYVLATDCIYNEGAMSEFATYLGIELLFALAFFAIAMVVAKNVKSRRYA